MVFACIAGGVLGIAFIIPLRKQMIDFERLTYPGGVAVASILKSPGAGIQKALILLSGVAVSALLHFYCQYDEIENWDIGALIGMPDYMNGVWYISLLTIGVGFIAGKGGFFFIIGGYVCYWLLAPFLAYLGNLPTSETLTALDLSMPNFLRLHLFRPVGIGDANRRRHRRDSLGLSTRRQRRAQYADRLQTPSGPFERRTLNPVSIYCHHPCVFTCSSRSLLPQHAKSVGCEAD